MDSPVDPPHDAWAIVPVAEVARRVRSVAAAVRGPVVVAVDGRSGAGKSTVSEQLAMELAGAPVVHTDDIAWHHSFFDWWPLLRKHILEPLRAGRDVSWRPAAWTTKGRPGSIDVPASPFILLEGVSASRRELADLLDVAIWVDGNIAEQERRGVLRDGASEGAQRFWDEWQASERPLLDADQPWDRADLLVLGTPVVAAPAGTWWVRWGSGGRLGG